MKLRIKTAALWLAGRGLWKCLNQVNTEAAITVTVTSLNGMQIRMTTLYAYHDHVKEGKPCK